MMKSRYGIVMTKEKYDYIYDQIEGNKAKLVVHNRRKDRREEWVVNFSESLKPSVRIIYDRKCGDVITALNNTYFDIQIIKSKNLHKKWRKLLLSEEIENYG
jgi:outer membrane protein assembly factor BamE (lipoprotein component of BamABCDE complex)